MINPVQRTLEHIRRSIETSISSRCPYLAAIYVLAYEYKKRWTKRRFRCRLMDALLFQPVKNRFSNQLKSIFVGGAATRLATMNFLKLHLNVNVTEEYGATESLGVAVATFDQFDNDSETVSFLSIRHGNDFGPNLVSQLPV